MRNRPVFPKPPITRKRPKAGQTIFDSSGKAIHLITCKPKGQEFVCAAWHKGTRKTIHLMANGKVVEPGYHDLFLGEVKDLNFGLVRWHHNRKKAINSSRIRMLANSLRHNPIHIITAKAPDFNGAPHYPDWYGQQLADHKANDFFDARISGSCSARADTQVFVSARVIEDPNNPENNGRICTIRMPKSRIDALSNLAKDLKEIK